jgi:hypothetical protein
MVNVFRSSGAQAPHPGDDDGEDEYDDEDDDEDEQIRSFTTGSGAGRCA